MPAYFYTKMPLEKKFFAKSKIFANYPSRQFRFIGNCPKLIITENSFSH